MITLKELFDDLAYGEFTNISLGKSDLGVLREEKYPNIVSALNLALIEIYKQFDLRRKEIVLYQQSSITNYYLRSTYAVETASAITSDAYILEDAEEPFEDDILKLISAEDSLEEKVYIDDINWPYDIFSMAPDIIKFSQEEGEALRNVTLSYRASYPKITVDDDFDPSTAYLYIPDYIRPALLLYIAHRIFMGKTSKLAEGAGNISVTFLRQFNNACMQLRLDNLVPSVQDEQSRFTNNGWV